MENYHFLSYIICTQMSFSTIQMFSLLCEFLPRLPKPVIPEWTVLPNIDFWHIILCILMGGSSIYMITKFRVFQSGKYDMATELLKRCLQYNKVGFLTIYLRDVFKRFCKTEQTHSSNKSCLIRVYSVCLWRYD